MITKETAAILFAYGYQLVDKEGDEYKIDCVANDGITLVRDCIDYSISMDANQIGRDFFILCRPLSDLAKEIEHNGEMFVPIERLNELNGTVAEYSHDYPSKSLPNWMVEKLYSWHFNIDFPEGTTKNLE